MKLALSAILLGAALSGCGKDDSKPAAETAQQNDPVSATFYVYDTVATIKIYDEKATEKNIDEIRDLLGKIDRELSRTNEDSDLYKVNAASGKEAVKVSQGTFDVVKLALDYAKETNGLLDPSIGPLINLWDIGHEGAKVPDKAKLEAARKLTDYRKVALDEANLTIKLEEPGMVLDLGSIGKGYAADQVSAYMREHDLSSALINLGGSSIIAVGSKPGGKDWNVGLQDPDQSRGSQLGTIKINDETIDSSGVYERFFMQDGVRYHHILDPRTGYPTQNGVMSITIVSDNATDADALSTAAFVMGLEDGMAYIEKKKGVEAFFVMDDNKIYATSGLKDRINLSSSVYKLAD
ncbi:FAD:protein FMN transferase [Saccharibacillus sp. CPCC 101409]|uniref:FAD:protein FMN transferase n=1 Tax=Saccharibacillus sp. CPCC 101409 TaxID=3058041 RepID=UPI002671DCE5|nr:FAD:protein FMN transferase [Saccharibacillus sp. CPCC 101409]MDO3408713.1 FAD:protein FMN transferase [Saccharibacillus sp. CPCC 101409]